MEKYRRLGILFGNFLNLMRKTLLFVIIGISPRRNYM